VIWSVPVLCRVAATLGLIALAVLLQWELSSLTVRSTFTPLAKILFLLVIFGSGLWVAAAWAWRRASPWREGRRLWLAALAILLTVLAAPSLLVAGYSVWYEVASPAGHEFDALTWAVFLAPAAAVGAAWLVWEFRVFRRPN
jgi:hypothetical protein